MLVNKWLGQNEGLCFDVVDSGVGSSVDTSKDTASSSQTETAPVKSDNDSRTFTEEDVARHAAEAQRKGKKIGQNQLLEELGVTDIDALKALIQAEQKRRESEMTETEKIQREKEKLVKDLEAERQARVELEQKTLLKERDSAVKEALRDAKARKPDNVLILLAATGKLDKLLAEDGTVKADAVKAVIADYQRENPEDFAPTSPGSPSNTGGRTPAPDSSIKVPKIRL